MSFPCLLILPNAIIYSGMQFALLIAVISLTAVINVLQNIENQCEIMTIEIAACIIVLGIVYIFAKTIF